MTKRPDNADEAISPTSIGPIQCESPVKSSRQNSLTTSGTTGTQDAAVLLPGDKEAGARLKREAERHLFQKVSNDLLGMPNGYKKVEVLLIRWHERIDGFKTHAAEIDRLKRLFEKDFGFGCTVAKLENVRHPQLELNHAINQHVMAHDGEGNLLIVYYTGHGGRVEDDRGLQLRFLEYVDSKNKTRPATAFWKEAEQPLRSHASADVLAILDCCFASTAAMKGISDTTRAYHLLAASSPEGVTKEPGLGSFTSALCDSLEELYKESKGEPFTLMKLWATINNKPGQCAMLWDRLDKHKQTLGHIELGRLKTSPERDASFENTHPERSSLTLRMSLKEDTLSDEQIKTLAHTLSVSCKEAEIPVRRVEWVEFEQRDNINLIRKVVEQMRRNSSKRKRSESRASRRPGPPSTRSQTRSSGDTLSLPARDLREGSATSEEFADSGLFTPPRNRSRDSE